MRRFFTIALLFCAAMAFAEPTEMPRFEIPTARSNSMGGHHVAYTDNVFSLLVNPAAMMRVQQKSFFALSPTLLSPQATFDLTGAFIDAAGGDIFFGLASGSHSGIRQVFLQSDIHALFSLPLRGGLFLLGLLNALGCYTPGTKKECND